MDYLTVKEYAELKGCTERYIKRLCKEGKIKAEQHPHPQNKQMCYMIPTSALSEELQAKYYSKLKSDLKIPEFKEDKESLKKSKKTVSKTFEEMSEAERCEANMWSEILTEWINIRSQYTNKAKADSMYVGKCPAGTSGFAYKQRYIIP